MFTSIVIGPQHYEHRLNDRPVGTAYWVDKDKYWKVHKFGTKGYKYFPKEQQVRDYLLGGGQ